ncbi:MAG: hypothetical protein ACR2HS_01465, partial [Gammaproteobacteria bacterium]
MLTYGQILFNDNNSGIVFTNTNGVATITGYGAVWGNGLFKQDLNYVLKNLTYSNSSSSLPSSVNLEYNFNGSYGNCDILVGNTTININQINNTPTLSVPSNINITENHSAIFSGANLISGADDSSTGIEKISLSVSNGTLNLNPDNQSQVTIISGGNGTNAITITGTIAQLNTALNSLFYTPKLNSIISDTLVINLN